MAISYPLTPPSPFRVAKLTLTGMSAVSRNVSPFTFQSQQYNWTGQMWTGTVECPPMTRADAEQVVSFLLSAQRGTFYFRDYANGTPRGNIAGTLNVAAATINTTTLTLANAGATGQLAVGDWISISNSLYKVVQSTSQTSCEVFPLLRASYAAATPITFINATGIFRLAEPRTDWSIDLASIYGVSFSIFEDVQTA